MSSGDCTVIPGYEFTGDAEDRVTKAKLNAGFAPAVRVNEGAVGTRELTGAINNVLSYAGIKNAIINPQFDFWTRKYLAGPHAHDPTEHGGILLTYAADRWMVPSVAGRTWERIEFPVGQTEVPDFPRYMLRWTQASALSATAGYPLDGTPGFLGQRVAGVLTFAGHKVTWAIWVRATTGITVQMQLGQFFGFSGSHSDPVTTAPQSYTLAPGVWTKLVYTVDLPSVAGKFISSDGLDWLEARCIMPAGVAFQVDFAHAQLQLGDNADSWEFRHPVMEISLCNLFFERTQCIFSTSLATTYPCFYFNTPKRNTPSIVIDSISAGTGATIQPLAINGFYQDTANSAIGVGVILADAELW